MDTTGRYLDGNAVGGLLQEIFVPEPTAAERICPSCSARHPTGAHRAYVTAGIVLRCPTCGDVAARIAELPGRQLVELRGTWIFATGSGDSPPTASRRRPGDESASST
jgi:hypothetical protein